MCTCTWCARNPNKFSTEEHSCSCLSDNPPFKRGYLSTCMTRIGNLFSFCSSWSLTYIYLLLYLDISRNEHKFLVNLHNVNLEKWLIDPNNVYIGRLCYKISQYQHLIPNFVYGNPFQVKDNRRLDSIKQFINYFQNSKQLIEALPKLKNKSIGCWCYPEICHGQALLYLLKHA